MLDQPQLTEALTAAVKAADPSCGRWCRTGVERDENTYQVHHSGIRDADVQTIHNAVALALSKDDLTKRLTAWLGSCHERKPLDLNGAVT